MGNCKDCKHWKAEKWLGTVRDYGECTRIEYGKESDLAWHWSGDYEYPGPGLMTKETFGCVLFEAK